MEVGTIIDGKLRVERVLGRGGMGVVVVATHLKLNQQVAVKVLRDELATDAVTVERFVREGQACAQLRSEHVCRVFDVGTLPSGAPYLVMELLAGDDLAAIIKQRPMTIAESVDALRQACEAIGEAHALGIVHRDLKPANLFVTRRPDGTRMIKVLDFGIAKLGNDNLQLTQTAAMMGSPGYMSPEQLRSARDVDARTDIWALGAILYQCVSGRLPFPATTITELVARVLADPPQPLQIEPRFDAIVMRCLEKDPARRYPSVAALMTDLLALGGPATIQTFAGPATIPPVAHPAPRRGLYALGGFVAVGAIVAIAATRHGDPAPAAVPPSLAARVGTDGTREGAYARALFDHRCDDALAMAKALDQPALIDRAKACTPREPLAKKFPETVEGAANANLAGDREQAFAIAESLLVHRPTDQALLQIAGLVGCELRNPRAQVYVPRITDAKLRAFIVEQCRELGVAVP